MGVSLYLWIRAIRMARRRAAPPSRAYKFSITPFQIFVIGFFIAAVIAFYPAYYLSATEVADGAFIRFLQALLYSLRNVLQLFALDGDLECISLAFSAIEGAHWLDVVYHLYVAALAVAAPVMTAGFVLSFFREFSSLVHYYSIFNHRADIFLISELNERSIALARDLLSDRKARRLVVFADVYEREEEESFELIAEAKQLGAICLRRDITEIGLKRTKDIFRKLYFISDNEDENVEQALRIINRCRRAGQEGESIYDTPKTQLYVFATSAESEALLDSVDKGNMKVRRINENRNLAIDTLARHPIFLDAEGPLSDYSVQKQLNIVIVGLGGYGKELLKAVSWSSQMPGFSPTIHVFDNDEYARDRIMADAPELLSMSDCHRAGEAQYSIRFHKTDVTLQGFLEELSSVGKITTVFVTLGNDEKNIKTAMRIRMHLGRLQIERGGAIPPIYAVVYSPSKSRTVLQNGGLKNMRGESYGITFVGDLRSRYSLESIEMPALEQDGFRLHREWVNSERLDARYLESYNKFEYFRRSSMSKAFYQNLCASIGLEKFPADTSDPNELAHNELMEGYEHIRWSTFMRAEGYVHTALEKNRNDIAKTHYDLGPYAALADENKLKKLIDQGTKAKNRQGDST